MLPQWQTFPVVTEVRRFPMNCTIILLHASKTFLRRAGGDRVQLGLALHFHPRDLTGMH